MSKLFFIVSLSSLLSAINIEHIHNQKFMKLINTHDYCSVQALASKKTSYFAFFYKGKQLKNIKYIYLFATLKTTNRAYISIACYDKNNKRLLSSVHKVTKLNKLMKEYIYELEVKKNTYQAVIVPIYFSNAKKGDIIYYKNIRILLSDRKLDIENYIQGQVLYKSLLKLNNEKEFFDSLDITEMKYLLEYMVMTKKLDNTILKYMKNKGLITQKIFEEYSKYIIENLYMNDDILCERY